MAEITSTTPYLVRAIHEWCLDNGLTPHLVVKVDSHTRVPIAFVKEGEIVLNINFSAVKSLNIDQFAVSFSARFSGIAQEVYVPMNRVAGIFARENGQGMFFEVKEHHDETSNPSSDLTPKNQEKKSHLKVVK